MTGAARPAPALRPGAVLAVALAASLAASCITETQVRDERTRLSGFLSDFEEAALICAPRELAEARANLAFAVYEADEGQTHRAWRHVRLAEKRSQQAWDRSRDPACEKDTDLDGIRDSKDRCPTEPEDFDGDQDDDGCPEHDRDGDGIGDEQDKCPDQPEDKDGFQDEDGCPDPDNDLDGIRDSVDQCPDEAEDRDGFQDIDGCPDPDNDGDGLPDTRDKCPNEAEDFDGDQDDDGCPDEYKTIVITQDRIELKQTIFFATAKARILPQSFPLMDEVADALRRRTEIRVRIEGHTDSRGSDRYNRKLSQARADSVRTYLIQAGIDPTRMQAVGFGEDVPIDDNSTEEGRARNRRVEFHILR